MKKGDQQRERRPDTTRFDAELRQGMAKMKTYEKNSEKRRMRRKETKCWNCKDVGSPIEFLLRLKCAMT